MDLPIKPPKIFTVSELTEEIKSLLEEEFEYAWVEGEISNFARPSSGHYYMSLKDEQAQIRAVMFRMQAHYLKFLPEDGMNVIVRGRLSVYEPRGEYQLILDYLEPLGVGALAAAFEQVKKKLALEGLFDKEKKKAIPFLPARIALITSPTGAAVRDFLRVSSWRMPNLDITVVPVRVQGDGAASDIINALELVNSEFHVDVVVLTRGGGSLEDLWPFNQEEVARAIRRSAIPVVSAVGHEVDLTISDLAADLRAPTPSAGAEMIIPDRESLLRELHGFSSGLIRSINGIVDKFREKTSFLSARVKDPRRGLADSMLRLDDLYRRVIFTEKAKIDSNLNLLNIASERLLSNTPAHNIGVYSKEIAFQRRSLYHSMGRYLDKKKKTLQYLTARLESLNPFSILKRGYSIARRLPDMEIVKDAKQVKAGTGVNIMLAHGNINCLVKSANDGK